MTDSGKFRVGFRGFRKEDVLKFIEDLQADYARKLADADVRRAAAEDAASLSSQRALEAEKTAQEAAAQVAVLKDQIAKLTALAQVYKRELVTLREEAQARETAAKDEVSELDTAKDRIRELTEQNALLKTQNDTYREVVGDMSSLLVEAHVLSASYFDNAHQKSVECIDKLDAFLDDMKVQAQQARFMSDVQKQTGAERIETLLEDLQRRGETLVTDSSKES